MPFLAFPYQRATFEAVRAHSTTIRTLRRDLYGPVGYMSYGDNGGMCISTTIKAIATFDTLLSIPPTTQATRAYVRSRVCCCTCKFSALQ